MKRLLSVPDVAERFDVTNQTVRNWIASGRLVAVQPAGRGRYRIPPEALRAFEESAARPASSRPMSPEIATLVRTIVDAVHPTAVILFGSRARGDARPDSDIDLAVVAPDATHRRRVAMAAYEAVAHVRDRSAGVDLVVLTPELLATERDVPGSIASAVLREGVALYGSIS